MIEMRHLNDPFPNIYPAIFAWPNEGNGTTISFWKTKINKAKHKNKNKYYYSYNNKEINLYVNNKAVNKIYDGIIDWWFLFESLAHLHVFHDIYSEFCLDFAFSSILPVFRYNKHRHMGFVFCMESSSNRLMVCKLNFHSVDCLLGQTLADEQATVSISMALPLHCNVSCTLPHTLAQYLPLSLSHCGCAMCFIRKCVNFRQVPIKIIVLYLKRKEEKK